MKSSTLIAVALLQIFSLAICQSDTSVVRFGDFDTLLGSDFADQLGERTSYFNAEMVKYLMREFNGVEVPNEEVACVLRSGNYKGYSLFRPVRLLDNDDLGKFPIQRVVDVEAVDDLPDGADYTALLNGWYDNFPKKLQERYPETLKRLQNIYRYAMNLDLALSGDFCVERTRDEDWEITGVPPAFTKKETHYWHSSPGDDGPFALNGYGTYPYGYGGNSLFGDNKFWLLPKSESVTPDLARCEARIREYKDDIAMHTEGTLKGFYHLPLRRFFEFSLTGRVKSPSSMCTAWIMKLTANKDGSHRFRDFDGYSWETMERTFDGLENIIDNSYNRTPVVTFQRQSGVSYKVTVEQTEMGVYALGGLEVTRPFKTPKKTSRFRRGHAKLF